MRRTLYIGKSMKRKNGTKACEKQQVFEEKGSLRLPLKRNLTLTLFYNHINVCPQQKKTIISVRVSRRTLKLALRYNRTSLQKLRLTVRKEEKSRERNDGNVSFAQDSSACDTISATNKRGRDNYWNWMSKDEMQHYLLLATSNVRVCSLRLFYGRLRLTCKRGALRKVRLLQLSENTCARVTEVNTAVSNAKRTGSIAQWRVAVQQKRSIMERLHAKQPIAGTTAVTYREIPLSKRLAVGKSRIHGRGLFSLERIQRGEFITEYIGEIIRARVGDVREAKYQKRGVWSTYMFELSRELVLDGTEKACVARFINHSCDANMKPRLVKGGGSLRIGFFGKRDIQGGEELTFDYNFEAEGDDKKILCLCAASLCRRYMN